MVILGKPLGSTSLLDAGVPPREALCGKCLGGGFGEGGAVRVDFVNRFDDVVDVGAVGEE